MYSIQRSNFATKNSKTTGQNPMNTTQPTGILKGIPQNTQSQGTQRTQRKKVSKGKGGQGATKKKWKQELKQDSVGVLSRAGVEKSKALSIQKIIHDILPKEKAEPLQLLIKQFARKKGLTLKFILQQHVTKEQFRLIEKEIRRYGHLRCKVSDVLEHELTQKQQQQVLDHIKKWIRQQKGPTTVASILHQYLTKKQQSDLMTWIKYAPQHETITLQQIIDKYLEDKDKGNFIQTVRVMKKGKDKVPMSSYLNYHFTDQQKSYIMKFLELRTDDKRWEVEKEKFITLQIILHKHLTSKQKVVLIRIFGKAKRKIARTVKDVFYPVDVKDAVETIVGIIKQRKYKFEATLIPKLLEISDLATDRQPKQRGNNMAEIADLPNFGQIQVVNTSYNNNGNNQKVDMMQRSKIKENFQEQVPHIFQRNSIPDQPFTEPRFHKRDHIKQSQLMKHTQEGYLKDRDQQFGAKMDPGEFHPDSPSYAQREAKYFTNFQLVQKILKETEKEFNDTHRQSKEYFRTLSKQELDPKNYKGMNQFELDKIPYAGARSQLQKKEVPKRVKSRIQQKVSYQR